jgi:hypothetical protein
MPNNNLDNPPVYDAIANVVVNGKEYLCNLSSSWQLWNSSFFDVLIASLFTSAVTTVSTSMTPNSGYILTSNTQLTMTLPQFGNPGDIVQVNCFGTSSFIIDVDFGQSIQYLSATTTANTGSIQSAANGTCVTLECVITNKNWLVTSVLGTITVI